MRVVYIVSLFPCWSETFIVREIRELLRLGVDVRIVSLKHASEKIIQSDAAALLDRVVYPDAPLRNALRALAGVATSPIDSLNMLARIARDLIRRPMSLGKSLVVWWRALGFVSVIREIAPDHLHAHWATYPSTAALVLTERLGKPFSFTSHAHDIFLENHLLEDKLREASFNVTISQFNKRYLGQHLNGVSQERIQVMHCGVILDDYVFRPEGRDACSILAVGRLDEVKGFRYLVDACGILAARGHDFTCDIIGDGPLRQALSERIAALGLGQRVRLLGVMKHEEVRQYLYSATAFVLPSVRTACGNMDGIPVSLMEAMAVGTPVVSTTVLGIPELVEDGVTGLLAAPGDPSGLADCIERFLGDATLACALARAARERIERDFDAEKEAHKLYECFKKFHGASTT